MGRRRQTVVGFVTALGIWLSAGTAATQVARDTANLGAALTAAARHGDVARVRALLRQGAPVDALGKAGGTPLMSAAMEGHADVARVLLQAGANPNARTRPSQNRRGKSGFTPLALAATNGKTEIAKMLLSKGAAANARVADGKTALMLACMWGYTDTVHLLLEHGARVDLKDGGGKTALAYAREGKTPLGYTERGGHVACIYLLERASERASVGHRRH
jgi:uncharacterized protein